MKRLWCLLFGHVRTDWALVTWMEMTVSGSVPAEYLTSNWGTESRFCLRCHSGYQQRPARQPDPSELIQPPDPYPDNLRGAH